MKAFAQTIDLKDDPKAIEDYKRAHEKVWPEVIRAVSEVGVQKMKIFLVGTHLFMYYEAPDDFDPARDFWRYKTLTPKAGEWDEWMRTLMQLGETKQDAWWASMEEVFDLQSQLAALPPLETSACTPESASS